MEDLRKKHPDVISEEKPGGVLVGVSGEIRQGVNGVIRKEVSGGFEEKN